MKRLVIKILRHAESESNVDIVDPTVIGDDGIKLTARGDTQSLGAGPKVGKRFIKRALRYISPYVRTVQTYAGALRGVGLDPEEFTAHEDPLLREIDKGYVRSDDQMARRKRHGWFYYRFDGGESPADCYNRACLFLESMFREVERTGKEEVFIVSHGLFMRVLIMRFLHLTVAEYLTVDNPDNCDVVTIAPADMLKNPQFVKGRWGVEGLRIRKETTSSKKKAQHVDRIY